MTLSMQEAIRQNTVGDSEGLPLGVPTSYSWYSGELLTGVNAPPSNFSAVSGWGQVYQDSTRSTYTNPNARVEVANAQTYVHLKSTGKWVLVQNQANDPIAGGHFAPDFSGAAQSMTITKASDGAASFDAPTPSYNDHFWPAARGTYTPGDVDAVYTQMDMRVTDPKLHVVANVGADWWRDATAPYVNGFSNNPGAGMSDWVDLTTQWKTLAFYSSPAIFKADPPPPLAGSAGDSTSSMTTTTTAPTTITTPTTTPTTTATPPATGANLLVNGSFEDIGGARWTPIGGGQATSASSVPGWTAIPGGMMELWDNVNGVKATNGSNFGELDYLGAEDGFYQDVRTAAGQTYNLTFDARLRPNTSAATSTIEVLWNDKVVASVPPGGNWATYSFRVTGTGGSDRLTFREAAGQEKDGLGALYDNVSLVATNSPAPTSATSSAALADATTSPAPATMTATSSNLLVNGSFEATPLASNQWRSFDSLPGWTAISGGTIELWNNVNGVKATNGSNFGELDALGARDGLYQTVGTEAAQTYKLSFDARLRPNTSAATSTIEVLWNDKVVASVPPGSNWKTYNFTVTGTGGNDRLTFREAQNGSRDGLGALYDNVSLVAVGSRSTAAPVSATQTDRAVDLMTQYSASTVTGSNSSSASVFDQTGTMDSHAPTLTNTHQMG